ncbi:MULTISPECIES: GspE/PulE family protein [unclassified Pseudomonas]|uniref:GspE/PulE family protein n=1 Tax=unclassified Pseudomonas TaxID=196821 RepID=UPI0008EF5129|nr:MULTISPECIES: GspE/PulE family protein [unclassified Pseudomonas]PMV19377.1 type II/IV secretion system protein [Pseudomonas sp. FW305-3-2-15-C-TSA2]PMV21163.1 type II/IV secretion system protein [Pseudomonas sp. DP16D-L5]PMV34607.1 type II/IV secretion system protein [Pseudomonas sp. FW305-3-2-15-A-LB2]PMV44750.1 type II/IV secretion system protein [Pseudomonas sp. FW305-3-2-15-C-R2A1]PMV50762.1 type II/IV secretion system protein [Pseudomonas sp. FW305-3-2-15-C-LB1]
MPVDQRLELRQLLPALLEGRVITPEVAQQLSALPASNTLHPLESIAALGPSLETLTEWLAQHAGQPYLRIDPLKIDVATVVPLMSHAFAQRHAILAVAVDAQTVTVASAQPHVTSWEAGLAQVLKRSIKRVVANPHDITRCIGEFYRLAKSVSGADQKVAAPGNNELLNLGASDQEPDANDAHIVNIVDWLLQYAFGQRASDIHIEPCREQGRVRFRIDGLLHDVYQFPPQVTMAVVSRLKSLGRMNVAEKRRPQDGRVKTKSPTGAEVELRLSTLPTAFGEKLVMRIFDPQVLLKGFDQLGLSVEDQQRWQAMTSQTNGIILVTGPTGSGKTSTLYTTLKQLATREVNLCTVEDPIEMVEPAFNQMQVQHNIDLTFASGIRALLRQDPDIIMIGEIRDQETAEMAIQAALTGHLVLSTLHTNDAPSAISRLQELGIAHYLIKATLLGVMAQRLVRVLCPHCKRALGDAHEAVGCVECRHSGYQGRAGVYEIMVLNEALRTLITPGADVQALRQAAVTHGMRSLRMAGMRKVAAGLTTMAEVLRVTPGDSVTNPLFVKQ